MDNPVAGRQNILKSGLDTLDEGKGDLSERQCVRG